jgi:orotate phosphoribosyltransferase-like protein
MRKRHAPLPDREARLHRGLELARMGHSYDEIAHQLGYSNRSGAWKLVARSLKASTVADVEEHRALEVRRLDALQSAIWDAAMSGDCRAVQEVLRIIQARINLLGLTYADLDAEGVAPPSSTAADPAPASPPARADHRAA